MSEIGREASGFQESLPTRVLGRALRRRVLSRSGEFDCGLRVVTGSVPGEGARWKHRRSHVVGDTLHHGSVALRLELGEQSPHPGGFNLSARCVVWQARAIEFDAEIQLAFAPADAGSVLVSELARGRELSIDPHIDDL